MKPWLALVAFLLLTTQADADYFTSIPFASFPACSWPFSVAAKFPYSTTITLVNKIPNGPVLFAIDWNWTTNLPASAVSADVTSNGNVQHIPLGYDNGLVVAAGDTLQVTLTPKNINGGSARVNGCFGEIGPVPFQN